jgi:hypothetical protein
MFVKFPNTSSVLFISCAVFNRAGRTPCWAHFSGAAFQLTRWSSEGGHVTNIRQESPTLKYPAPHNWLKGQQRQVGNVLAVIHIHNVLYSMPLTIKAF